MMPDAQGWLIRHAYLLRLPLRLIDYADILRQLRHTRDTYFHTLLRFH